MKDDMKATDLKLVPTRSSVSGNVVLRWASRNAAAVAVAAALAAGIVAVPVAAPATLAVAASGEQAQQVERVAAEGQAVFQKSEVAYVDLSYDGAPEGAYVVNRFDVEQGGSVVDHGGYTLVKNLTNTEEIALADDAATFDVSEGTFFYQGNLGKVELPWDIHLEYSLDGKKVDADELAGKDGHVDIAMSTSQNPDVDPAFFDSFMLQVSFTLDPEKCSNLVADGATVSDAGADQTVAFTVLPGKDGSLTLSADVTDFEMAGVQVVGMAYSSPVDVPDTSGVTDGMQQLADGVSEVASGSSSLAGGGSGLVAGAHQLSDGAAKAAEGAGVVAAGGDAVLEGTKGIGDGIKGHAEGIAALNAYISTIPGVPDDLKKSIGDLAAGMQQLNSAYGQYAAGVEQYVDGVDGLATGLGELESGSSSLAAGIRRYVSGMEQLNGGIQSLDDETSKLPSVVQGEIDDMMAEFDFPEFAPRSFVSAQNSNVRSVQFVMTTPDISLPDEDEPEAEQPEETFADRFFNLFR